MMMIKETWKKYVQFSARAVRRPDTGIILRIFIFWRMRTVQDHQQRNNNSIKYNNLVQNFYFFFKKYEIHHILFQMAYDVFFQ